MTYRITMLIVMALILFGCESSDESAEEHTASVGEEGVNADAGIDETNIIIDPCADVVCDDGNPCTDDSCDIATGECLALKVPDRTCDDNNACTLGDTCNDNGVCVGGESLVCDDNDGCTTNECDSVDGCFFETAVNGEPCNDGNACTLVDACEEGVCVGVEQVCDDDLNPCTVAGGCDEQTGDCLVLNVSDDTLCEDGNDCTDEDHCESGECVSTQTTECFDGNACTDDGCTPKGGCTYFPNTDFCDDGSLCTSNDQCLQGQCNGTTLVCDDENDCTNDGCDPEVGCVNIPVEIPCDDGNLCTINDTCANGLCASGQVKTCDDNNACTEGYCELGTGDCAYAIKGGSCDDGSVCTTEDTCTNGACNGSVPLDCDDGIFCTNDSCDPVEGCAWMNADGVLCDDDNPCTAQESCDDGQCAGGTPIVCNDNNDCTYDSCSSDTGCVYTNNTALCDDGNPCTTEDLCNEGSCLGGVPSDCDDGVACTNDTCNPASGCVYEANDAGCDKGNPCSDYSCDLDLGCVITANANDCTDNNACTVGDVCIATVCVPGVELKCDDDNACTDDSCDTTSGCVNAANSQPCDDGDACTLDDICVQGSCPGGAAAECDDSNACTDDSCDNSLGCVNAANSQPCTDNNACTVGDVCIATVCVPGVELKCDDDNACTDDSCDTTSGCVNAANSQPCDDGDACTLDDICVQGSCPGGAAAECDDSNACTDDSCDNSLGCVNAANSQPCTDNNVCTVGDVCIAKECVVGAAPNCDDDNACTNDSCDSATGCLNAPNTNPCDDGDACTTGDACVQAACGSGPTTNCDDNNLCTNDSCDSATGCVYADKCDDGKPCTANTCDPNTGGCSYDVPLCGGWSTENGEECSCDKNCAFSGPNNNPNLCCSDACEICPCTAAMEGGMGCDIDWENPPSCMPGQSIETYGQSCQDIQEQWLFEDPPDGVYWVIPDPWGSIGGPDLADAFQVYCDMTTDGGGWTVTYFVDAQHWNPKLANDCDPSGTPPLGVNDSSGVWNPHPDLENGLPSNVEILVSCGESFSGGDHYWTFYWDSDAQDPNSFFDGIVGDGSSQQNYCFWDAQPWENPVVDGFDGIFMYTSLLNTNTGKVVEHAGIDKSAGQLWLSTSSSEYNTDEEIVWGGGQVYPEYSDFVGVEYGICDSAKQCNTTCEPYGFFNSPWDGGCVVYPICNGVQSNTARFKIAVR